MALLAFDICRTNYHIARFHEVVLSPDDRLWLAGYLEGEGSFSCHSAWHDSRGYTPPLTVSMSTTDEDVASRVASMLNANYNSYMPKPRSDAKRKLVYQVKITGGKALSIMTKLLPLMSCRRRQQIVDAITAWRPARNVLLRKVG